jgi:hypothetical protein
VVLGPGLGVCPSEVLEPHLGDLVYHPLTADSVERHFVRCSGPSPVLVVAGTSTVVRVHQTDCEVVEGDGGGVHDGGGAGGRVGACEVSEVANSVVVVVVLRGRGCWSAVNLPGAEEGL